MRVAVCGLMIVVVAAGAAGCAQGSGSVAGPPGAADASAVRDSAAADAVDDLPAPVDDAATPADAPSPDVPSPDVPAPDVLAPDAPPGDAGCGAVWPTCDARPAAATPATIAELWAANPARPALRWVSGAVVTAVSRGACVADAACQIYVQEPSATSTLAESAHHAIKVFVSAASASRFASVRVGDRVDLAASAWRYNVGGQNELLLQVADSCALRGCMARTGDGSVTPTPATLDTLSSVAAYETTYGPVLLRLSGVAATTDAATPLTSTTGGLFVPGAPLDGGRTEAVSVSPYFMPGGHFVGYAAGQRLRFTSLVGVFGMFIPSGAGDAGAPKYLQVYPRAADDLTLM